MAVGGAAKPPANSAVLVRWTSSSSASGLPTGLGDEPVPNLLVQMAGDGGGEQRLRVVVGEAVEGQVRHAAEEPLVGRLPDREQKPDGLGQQASADELQHLGGGDVEPLGVVDQAHHRSPCGGLRQQTQHRQPDQEPIRDAPGRQPERDPQRVLLGFRQRGEVAEHRRAQLVQRRQRQLQLGLHAGELSDPTAGGLARAVVQQRGLTDAGLTADDQHGALAAAHTVQKVVEYLALAVSALGRPAFVLRPSGNSRTSDRGTGTPWCDQWVAPPRLGR